MMGVGEKPAREIAFDYRGTAVAHVAAANQKKCRARIKGEFDAGLKAGEIEPRLMRKG